MPNNYYQFKQFTIYHDKCAMKVGTDGVLLGAWANVEKCTNILDIGTGTGLIAIMVAQRTNTLIDAVEIEESAYNQAKTNAQNCPWNEKISVHHCSIQDYSKNTKHKYQSIVSNPPYFSNSLKSVNENKTIARHNDLLSSTDLLQACNKLLSSNGNLSVIMPYAEGCLFIVEAAKMGLFCNRKTNVKSSPHTNIIRLLLEFSKIPVLYKEDNLTIYTDETNEYSEKYKNLTKEFYLNF